MCIPRISSRRVCYYAAVCLLVWMPFNTPARAAVEYTITTLGNFGGTNSGAYDINEAGIMAGRAEGSDGWFRAVRWLTPNAAEEIEALHGVFSEAWGINNAGQIVGRSHVMPANEAHAFRYDPGIGTLDLGTLGGAISDAYRINDSGVAVGSAELADGQMHAARWDAAGNPFDLGTFGGDQSEAIDINAAGHIVGWAAQPPDEFGEQSSEAFIWTGSELNPVGTLGGLNSFAHAINDAGLVAGFSDTETGDICAFLWDEQQGMQNIGNMGGGGIVPWDISNTGKTVVVGYADDSQGLGIAIIWDEMNGLRDLNALIPPDSDWIRLREARGVNEAGQIVGYGLRREGWHAFLLTPVPEPGTLLCLIVAATVLMHRVPRGRVIARSSARRLAG